MNIMITSDAGILGSNLAVHRLVQSNEPVILTNKPEEASIKSSVRGEPVEP
jgi:hypothetical protein